jgi:hypothetical protein
MKNARDWYLCGLFARKDPQVLGRVVESPLINYQPMADCSKTSLQIHDGTCTPRHSQ